MVIRKTYEGKGGKATSKDKSFVMALFQLGME